MCWLIFKKKRKEKSHHRILLFSAAHCGGRVTGQSGVIESSGYPTLPYRDNLFCEWHLEGPSGHYLTIHFEDFNLQNSSGCEKDFVEIWESHTSGQCNMSAVFWGCLFSHVLIQPLKCPLFKKGKTTSILCMQGQSALSSVTFSLPGVLLTHSGQPEPQVSLYSLSF